MKFILILLSWFISSILFPFQSDFYELLNLPFFTPPNWIFIIIWPILYILISISVNKILSNYNLKDLKEYFIILLTNYLFNQSYSFFFFKLQNLFLSFVASLGTFVSSLFLYYKTKQLDKDGSKYLIPYILWNGFATILSLTIYFMNF